MTNQANENATYLFKIYLRQMLSSKKVVLLDKLNSQSFDWILGEIKSKFD
jgi:DNA-directed RNA polymerase II subunit RPB1